MISRRYFSCGQLLVTLMSLSEAEIGDRGLRRTVVTGGGGNESVRGSR